MTARSRGVHDFQEQFAGRGYGFHAPPTVLAELEALSTAGRAPRSGFANTALEKLRDWNCAPFAFNEAGLLSVHPAHPKRLLQALP